jgi:uncharacterized membrane protein
MKKLIALLILMAHRHCLGQEQATVRQMHVPAGYENLMWMSLSGDGRLATGTCTTSVPSESIAILWDTDTGDGAVLSPEVGHAIAFGISSDGSVVVGSVHDAQANSQLAALWRNGVLQVLGLPGSTMWANASGCSSDGSVVFGDAYDEVLSSSPNPHGWIWRAGRFIELPTLPGTSGVLPTSMSADGLTVVGYSLADARHTYGVRWSRGRPEALAPPGEGFEPLGLSADGQIAVGVGDVGNDVEPLMWRSGSGLEGFHSSPRYGVFEAIGVSAAGDVVLFSGIDQEYGSAIFWTRAGGVRGLSSTLNQLGVGAWDLEPFAISANGRSFACHGTHFNGQEWEDYGPLVATLPPEQICYANCDVSTTPPFLNIADFTCFLQRFAQGDDYANCDQSTTPPLLNVADFTCFLQKFAAGCQ